MNANIAQGWWTENLLVRRAAEAVMHAANRRHLTRFDRGAPVRCQSRILLGLVHQAQATRFGREHDFRRIRTVADYRRLVPLCTRAELWRDYWQPVYPLLEGATWPGRPSAGICGTDSFRLTPPSPALQAAHRAALRTALALSVQRDRERNRGHGTRRLLDGTLLFLTDEGPSNRTEPAILAERLPKLLRPFTQFRAEIEPERLASLNVTGLIGPLERLQSLFDGVKQACGNRRVSDIWPQLSTVLYTRRPSNPLPLPQSGDVGEEVLLLEMVGRAEGPIAVEDPRFGMPRLLFDHGVYFEFVPPDQVGDPRCPRFGIEEIRLGVPYELVVTSPAGLWACRVGRTVCLERRDPPLLRFLETAIQPAVADLRRPSRRTDLILPTNSLPAPHPQSGGTPAAPTETTSRSPWSILADRE